MARVYVRSITRSNMYLKLHFVRAVACGLSTIKIEYSDYPKSLKISIINEVNA